MGTFHVINRRLVLVLPMLLIGLLSCTQPNPDINRIIAPYYDKTFFNSKWQNSHLSPEEWYYRLTVTDTPTNTEAASIASGHWLHPETIRFELTEKFLIGWRAHASVPGSENDANDGALRGYRGVPAAVFRITDHFDIAREYDPVTTERSNVISENRDRSWDKRRFVRIDFSRNLAHDVKREDAYPWIWGSESIETDSAISVQQNDPANPKRSRFEDNYFEVTSRQGIKTDFFGYIGAYGNAYRYDNASPVVDIRFSFLKKPPEANYEPLPYPDHVFLVDENGKEIKDKKGFSKIEKIWERFGFYRAAFSGQQTWDPKRGSLESNKNYNITRFNIWKQSYSNETGPNGENTRRLIPLEKREPKPIVYYTNVEHPNSLLASSRRVASEWDRTFREMVFYAQPGKYRSIDDVPQMWVLHENSCNVANVKYWLEKIEGSKRKSIETEAGFSLSDIAQRIDRANDKSNQDSFTERHNAEAQAKADLERICSSLEYHTAGSSEVFSYQRPGDLRYSMMNLITKQAQTPWSGLGPMLADSLSGEIIQAQANVNLWYIDRRAAWASRQIDAMNGKIDLNDLVFGTDIKNAMVEKMAELRSNASAEPSQEALMKMDQRFFELSKAGELLVEIAPKHTQNRLARIAHTELENRLIEHEHEHDQQVDHFMLLGAKNHFGLNAKMGLSDEILNRVSPARGHDLVARFLIKEDERAKAAMLPVDPPEIIDPLVVGLAIRYKDLGSRERFEKIREAVYTAVMLHEIGHNMGLAHNMAGSSDALNYGTAFWELQELPTDLDAAKARLSDKAKQQMIDDCKKSAAQLTAQECLGQDEMMYSSIMDYHAAWNSDLGGLGPYDRAAIKFGYAQLIETFHQEKIRIDYKKRNLTKWLFLNDWKKIPSEFVKGVDSISNRNHEKYEWQHVTTKKPYPSHAVPYRYCIDSSGNYGSECKAFDFGPDMRSQAKWNEISYWQHYYFTHFANDRMLTYDWDFENIVSRDLQVMSDYSKIMRWYYFLRATDPEFVGSDAEKDYLSATISGLNHFAHVLGHPAPGQYASVPKFLAESSILVKADEDRLAPASLLLPWARLDSCVQANVAQITQKVPTAPKPGFLLAKVKLGDGRPFYMGLTPDYEDWYINYVGSFFTKLYAGFFLSNPSAWFPRTENITDPRAYAINWYRLFPKEVGKLFHDMITENWAELGPVVDAKGKFSHRNLVDPVTLEAPDYSGMATVMPGISTFLPYRSMFYAAALLSGNKMPDMDPIKTMKIAMAGGLDDIQTINTASADQLASFQHPITGNTYRALRVGEQPIAFNLVKRLNILKDKFERLNRCVEDENARASDGYCHCIKTAVEKSAGNLVCCQSSNAACPQIGFSKVGEGICSEADLRIRRDQAREDMEQSVSFIDDMRWFYESYANIP